MLMGRNVTGEDVAATVLLEIVGKGNSERHIHMLHVISHLGSQIAIVILRDPRFPERGNPRCGHEIHASSLPKIKHFLNSI